MSAALCAQNNNIFDVNMTARFLSGLLSDQLKDVQSIDSEEGEKIISHPRYCHCSEGEGDKEHGWHRVFNIFYILSDEGRAESCTKHCPPPPPPSMCVGVGVCGCDGYLVRKL